MAGEHEVRRLLATTTIPEADAAELLSEVSAIWLLSDRADALAGDLALCHPPLVHDEVRAVVHPLTTPFTWRLAMVTEDRRGLLASVAGALAAEGLSVTRAAATTWAESTAALLSVTLAGPTGVRLTPQDWSELTRRLRDAVAGRHVPSVAFTPRGPAEVRAMPRSGERTLVEIRALDRPGLLWAVASWLSAHDVDIEALRVDSHSGIADGVFVVVGAFDPAALVARLADGSSHLAPLGR